MRRVVVTGMGALTPIGNDLNEYWQNLLVGKSGAAAITKFDTSKHKVQFACELKEFDASQFFDPKEFKKIDPFSQYALITADEAIKDSGLDLDIINKDRVGVIWGSGNGGIQTFQDQMMEFCQGDGTPRFTPFFIPRILVDIASGWISIKYGFRGINFCPVSACATSTTAVIEAFNYIKWNKADIVVTGGSEAAINESAIGGFSSAKAANLCCNSGQVSPTMAKRSGKSILPTAAL